MKRTEEGKIVDRDSDDTEDDEEEERGVRREKEGRGCWGGKEILTKTTQSQFRD